MKTTILRFAAVALLAPLVLIPAVAQDGAKPRRVGVLMNGSLTDPVIRRDWQALVDGLRKHGWEEGRNVVLEGRFAGADVARFHELAAELVALKVDVIMCANTQATEAARRKTATIPLVMVNSTDPVTSGFVASFARPGGNITGLANHGETLVVKHFDLLREIMPGIGRVAIIYGPDVIGSVNALKQQEKMAPASGSSSRRSPCPSRPTWTTRSRPSCASGHKPCTFTSPRSCGYIGRTLRPSPSNGACRPSPGSAP